MDSESGGCSWMPACSTLCSCFLGRQLFPAPAGARDACQPSSRPRMAQASQVEEAWGDGAHGGEGVHPVSHCSAPASLSANVDLLWQQGPYEVPCACASP